MHPMLGKFDYCDKDHGWAIKVGCYIATYLTFRSKKADMNPSCHQIRKAIVEIIRQELKEHHITIQIPEIESGMDVEIIHNFTKNLLNTLGNTLLQGSIVIGIATSHLELYRALGGPTHIDTATRIMSIYAELELDAKKLVEAILVTDCKETSVRTLLTTLHAVRRGSVHQR